MDPAILRDRRLLAELSARLDRSRDPELQAERDLARSYGLLARELAAVRLTREEAAVRQVAARAAGRARIAGRPFGSFAEAVEAEVRRTEHLRSRFALDGERLVATVAAWTPAQTLAVLDACERVRAVAHRGGSTTLAELLREAGPPESAHTGPSGRRPPARCDL